MKKQGTTTDAKRAVANDRPDTEKAESTQGLQASGAVQIGQQQNGQAWFPTGLRGVCEEERHG
jgi:hypothetical protein